MAKIKEKIKLRLAIIGDRKVEQEKVLIEALAEFGFTPENVGEVVCGMAAGADTLGKNWAKTHKIPVIEFPAKWKDLDAPGAVIKKGDYGPYNSRAGFDRNKDIAEYSDVALALQSNGDTNGTQDCIKQFKKLDKVVHVYYGKKSDNNSDFFYEF